MKRRRVLVLCPHFAPDTAPTGVIYTRLVAELVEAGCEVRVVTALPWYRNHRIEDGWRGRLWRTEKTPWGCITRVTPFPGKSKKNIFRRAAGFIGFTALVGIRGLFSGGLGKLHAVIAMSPPLTLGLTGRVIASVRRAPLIFNIQDVFPDAAIATGKISGERLIKFAKWLEKLSYRMSNAVVLLSDDMKENVADKVEPGIRSRLHVIPNFVDTKVVTPKHRMTSYRYEIGLGDGPVVMYAG
ncbi:MAG: glycosyltransferase WbuB, partial [Actinobacteria bacterium]|nr:glycosyltransferase WbuB [Actinomycetota bacterium]